MPNRITGRSGFNHTGVVFTPVVIPTMTIRSCNRRRQEYGDNSLDDAFFLKDRIGDRVVSRAGLIVPGIRSDGYREILGVKIGDTESFVIWDETFRWLKGRGLKGVMFVVSDSHGERTRLVAKHFQGASPIRAQTVFFCKTGSRTNRS